MRAAAVGGGHPGQHLRPGRGTPPARRAEALAIPTRADVGRQCLAWGPLATWCATEGAWRVEIIKPTPRVQGFVVRPWGWMVERTLGWLGRQRRFSKDDERKV